MCTTVFKPCLLEVLILVSLMTTSASAREPDCSRFHYEEKLLEKMIRMEIHVETVDKHLKQCLDENLRRERQIQELTEKIQELAQTLSQSNKQHGSSGSTYVRWGRRSCPSSSTIVYEGIVAGSNAGHHGSGANYICLPSEPLWGTYDDTVSNLALIYGAEYVTSDSPVFQHLHYHEVPCVVCHVATSSILMVPGRNACYHGWTQEYAGYLMAETYGGASNKDFICVDGKAETTNCSSEGREGGADLYHVENACGSLKFPPNISGRELTCAVCSHRR